MGNARNALRNDIGNFLRDKYEEDLGEGSKISQRMQELLTDDMGGEELVKMIEVAVKSHAMGETLIKTMQTWLKTAKKPNQKEAKKEAKKVLVRLARSRIEARMVKILFKRLVEAFKNQ